MQELYQASIALSTEGRANTNAISTREVMNTILRATAYAEHHNGTRTELSNAIGGLLNVAINTPAGVAGYNVNEKFAPLFTHD